VENFDVDVSVQGYQIEMMIVCNYMMIMHRNVRVVLQTNLQDMGYEIAKR
jgi:hypothetical protein